MAFAAAVVLGWAADNSALTILYRAMLVMVVCWGVGFGVGYWGQRLIEGHIAAYKREHPIVVDDPLAPSAGAPAAGAAAEAPPRPGAPPANVGRA